jgi:hypothetical protein
VIPAAPSCRDPASVTPDEFRRPLASVVGAAGGRHGDRSPIFAPPDTHFGRATRLGARRECDAARRRA